MDSVSLFRCRDCNVKVYEQDCPGHLRRHGVDVTKLTATQILTHFERGPKTTSARPGANFKPMYPQARRRKTTQEDVGEPELDDDVN